MARGEGIQAPTKVQQAAKRTVKEKGLLEAAAYFKVGFQTLQRVVAGQGVRQATIDKIKKRIG